MFHRTCDGQRRRDFLRIGGITLGGLTLAQYRHLSAAEHKTSGHADRAIFIDLTGGPSHLDTFDPKPNASDEIRGSFGTIATRTPGVRFSEHLPKLADASEHFAVLRGVSHTLAAHRLGQEYVTTGSKPLPSLSYPTYGAVMDHQRPAPDDLPGHVAVPKSAHGAGFLGIRHAAMETNSTPKAGAPFRVRGITLPQGIDVETIRNRQALLSQLDRRFEVIASNDSLMSGMDRFGHQAFEMMTSRRAREAFDISREPDSFAKRFGQSDFGQSCLLALRLVESGVGFVSVQMGGWDTHQDNFSKLSKNLLPRFDAGLSGLLTGLAQRGLLERTAVYVTGEFGRTPKINSRSAEGGRDHYPRCMFMLMAGGGVRGGQVIGESDDTAAGPRHEPIKPDDVAASFYHNLGIDPAIEFDTETGRPITLVRDGKVIEQLFA
ncbi:MAG: DUF1501 domain-containing protein [Planctomycetota bacterium]